MSSIALRLPGLPRPGGQFWTLAALGVLALLTLAVQWIGGQRPQPPDAVRADLTRVTSGADAGPGSLREAIFAADRAPRRARIVLDTARIELRTPLPPLVNPEGVVIESAGLPVEIDASAAGARPVLDVAAPHTVLRGFTIRGAQGAGVLVQRPHARLSELTLAGCGEGVHVAEGASDASVVDSTFDGNRVGVLVSRTAAEVVVRGNRFRNHQDAGVRAVQPPGGVPGPGDRLRVRSNTFDGDAVGLLTANTRVEAEKNTVTAARDIGMLLAGPGVVARGNRVTQGRAYGIYAAGVEGAVLEDNEADGNPAVGIVLRDSLGSVVRNNRVYANGYGVVVLFGDPARPDEVAGNLVMRQAAGGLYVVGGSPRVLENDVRGNAGAALQVDAWVPRSGGRREAKPLLRGNTLQGNGTDTPVHGTFREAGR